MTLRTSLRQLDLGLRGEDAAETGVGRASVGGNTPGGGGVDGFPVEDLGSIECTAFEETVGVRSRIGTPFPDVAEDVVQAEFVGGKGPNSYWSRALRVRRSTGYSVVKPGVSKKEVPLRLGRQSIGETGGQGARCFFCRSEFTAEIERFLPGDIFDRLRGLDKFAGVGPHHQLELSLGHFELADPGAMCGAGHP